MSHTITEKDRDSPMSSYVICEDCGRTENTEEELEQRPCKSGIEVGE